ncbi:MAG: alpha amylase C-terminal domain-containing protein [Clostridiales Family XIII bacterium]|jgi:1,4-alpha-glucan branching enzyme|nr:alpha amylase C-terminal domain-containing protein [Clostridiales Family XIII bacterium]
MYEILDTDPLLRPFRGDIELRMQNCARLRARLLGDAHESLSSCANGHMFFGFHRCEDGWVYREWAPNAVEIRLFGDFNGWDRASLPLRRRPEDGIWEVFVRGEPPHGSKVRILVRTEAEHFERIPLYAKRVVQDPLSLAFDGQIWLPEQPFAWTDAGFARDAGAPLLIYEAHVGMSGERAGIASYAEFRDFILPKVRDLGYNAIQLMAVMEHPYYGSFGYQVSNFFAVSSRFGLPEDLKSLIDTAHGMGLAVFLDLVHSHAARNETEGIARFDGTVYQFFHRGARGDHPQWDSKLFDYGNPGVLHFLLSNLKFWLEEYHFDGFRFDGVTSMLYHDHGLGVTFDNYKKYFSMNTDLDALAYLQLATELCREVKPDCTLVAEDMSGMPGMCLPITSGGVGFDYRLGMGLPDLWIRYLDKRRDEDWDVGALWYELTQRRPREKVVGYCESHDQALVGDKTIMFRLADKDMYSAMDKASQNPRIDRAVALHKMIRLITCTCAGEAYLNFMGNEFGHPEWIDFPRPGNGNSYHYARRQWNLPADGLLRYHFLEDFDRAMIRLVKENRLLGIPARLIFHHEDDKLLAYRKGRFLFFFNLHPVRDGVFWVPSPAAVRWTPVLHTSWTDFGGYRPQSCVFLSQDGENKTVAADRRSALVFEESAGD